MPQNAQPLLQVSDLTKSYEGKRDAQEQHHALSGVILPAVRENWLR